MPAISAVTDSVLGALEPVALQTDLSDIEAVVRNLTHDLRQPLSAIEAIAYYLEMTLPPDQLDARKFLIQIQQMVERANSILVDAVQDARCRV